MISDHVPGFGARQCQGAQPGKNGLRAGDLRLTGALFPRSGSETIGPRRG
jgi:hypothetical protein